MATQEDVCPDYVGENWIGLELADPLARRAPYEPVVVAVTYAGRPDEFGGVCLPLELIITAPDKAVDRLMYVFTRPKAIVWTPRVAGDHVMLLREMAHNLWTGTLHVIVGEA